MALNSTLDRGFFHLSRRFDLVEVLPAALYKCASELSISTLFSSLNASNKHPYCLSAAELKECLETRDYLASQTRINRQVFANGEVSIGCVDSERCKATLKEMVFEYYKEIQATDCDAAGSVSFCSSATGAGSGLGERNVKDTMVRQTMVRDDMGRYLFVVESRMYFAERC